MSDGDPLRIGIIAPPWVAVPPNRYGGTEVVIDQLARALVALGHSVSLFATGESTCPVERFWVIETAPGVHVGGAAVEMRQAIAAYRAFEGLDIVHDHTSVGPLYASLAIDGPVVTTNHNRFEEPFNSIYRALSHRIPVIAISRDHAASAVDAHPVAVIHHGVDPADFPFNAHPQDYALFLGRISPDKGIVEAIHIARAARVPLVIGAKMSDADEISYFHEQVEPHLDDRCRYLGEVDRSEKLRLLSGARFLLNPIMWDEPFGMAMIEALACGTPVVARRRGGAAEIVKEGISGLLGDTDDDLVAAIGQVGKISRESCRAYLEEHFSAERMAEQHLELYRRVIADAGGCPVSLRIIGGETPVARRMNS